MFQPGHAVIMSNSAVLPESCFALFFLRCVVFAGVIWSSSSRYGGRAAGAQHPSGHPEAQLPVEAGHEYFSGCLGAACWTCQGIYKHHKFRLRSNIYAAVMP